MSKNEQNAQTVKTQGDKTTLVKLDLPTNLNVSQTIRWLAAAGLTRGQTVKYFQTYLGRDIRYQHVRNVLITPVKKS